MKRRARLAPAFASLLLIVALLTVALRAPARALEEADRLWLVGERAAADGVHVIARRALEQLVERFPGDARRARALLLLGRARLALGDAEGALDAFRRAQTATPPLPQPLEATFWEGEALFRLKRYAEAAQAFDAVVRTDAAAPFAPDALYGLAWSQLELKRPAEAAAAFRELLATWPDHAHAPTARFYLGRALVELKRPAEAVSELQAFLARHPGHALAPEARYLLGVARVESGDLRGGLADLRAFVEGHPSHALAPAARRVMAETLMRSSDPEDLQQAYRLLIAQTPPTAEALADAATVAGRLGRTREQEAAWRRLRAQFPDHPLARRAALGLALSAFNRKEWKDAAALAREAALAEDAAVRAEAWLLGGEAELKLRRWAAAEQAFQTALAVPGIEPASRYRALAGLGLAHEEQREWRAALEAYEAVATDSPDPTLRDWARERLAAVKSRLTPPRPAAPERRDDGGRPGGKDAGKKPAPRKNGA